jgi:hypothetical protein
MHTTMRPASPMIIRIPTKIPTNTATADVPTPAL